MKALLLAVVLLAACGGAAKPALCEVPPPEKKEIAVGACPVDLAPADAGSETAEVDAH